jgi:hypothetical protein
MKTAEIRLPGFHNQENVMAAALIGKAFGVDPRSMRASIRSFPGLEHRLEKVLTIGGVLFINDSKATTVEATIKALQSLNRRIVLILGGRDKGADFRLLRGQVRKSVKKIILLGEAREKIAAALRKLVPMAETQSLRWPSVLPALLAGKSCPGSRLYEPTCSYSRGRGHAFKREVGKLAESVRGRRLETWKYSGLRLRQGPPLNHPDPSGRRAYHGLQLHGQPGDGEVPPVVPLFISRSSAPRPESSPRSPFYASFLSKSYIAYDSVGRSPSRRLFRHAPVANNRWISLFGIRSALERQVSSDHLFAYYLTKKNLIHGGGPEAALG